MSIPKDRPALRKPLPDRNPNHRNGHNRMTDDRTQQIPPQTDTDLPPGWAWTTLFEVGRVVTGTTPSKKDPKNYGDYIPFVKPPELLHQTITEAEDNLSQIGAESARVLPVNSVLVSCIGNLGKTGINTVPVAFNQQINAVICHDHVEPKYVFYYCQTSDTKDWMEDNSSATTVTIINKSNFQRLPIPLAPSSEQRRIVEAIETQFTRLDAAVAGLERLRTNLNRYRQSVLKAACEGRLVPTEAALAQADGRSYEDGTTLLARILTGRRQAWAAENPKKKYKEPSAPDVDGLPDPPDGWVWASLEQLSWDSGYGTSQKCDYDAPGPPVLRIPNIVNGRINLDDLKFATKPAELNDDRKLQLGDLVLIRTNGSRNLIGKCAVVRDELQQDLYFASYLIRYRLVGSSSFYAWIASIWDSFLIREWLENEAATSAGQYNLSVRTLNRLPIPLPPLAEQQRIVEEVERRLSVVEQHERVIVASLRRAARLRQAILKRAFSGRLV